MTPSDPELYEYVKSIVYKQYKKHSAYRSGAVIKMYKKLGGEFVDDDEPKPLKRWFSEKWEDVNPLKTKFSYPVYRPTKIIDETTPFTVDEIDPENLLMQSIEKQKIKGYKNLQPFIQKNYIN